MYGLKPKKLTKTTSDIFSLHFIFYEVDDFDPFNWFHDSLIDCNPWFEKKFISIWFEIVIQIIITILSETNRLD